jgi:hypothetical protein
MKDQDNRNAANPTPEDLKEKARQIRVEEGKEPASIVRKRSLVFKGRYAKPGKNFFIVEARDPKKRRRYIRSIELQTFYIVKKKVKVKGIRKHQEKLFKVDLSPAHVKAIFEELENALLKDMGFTSGIL